MYTLVSQGSQIDPDDRTCRDASKIIIIIIIIIIITVATDSQPDSNLTSYGLPLVHLTPVDFTSRCSRLFHKTSEFITSSSVALFCLLKSQLCDAQLQ